MNVPEFWKKIEGGICSYAWTEKWIAKAYTFIWHGFYGLSFVLMTGLYSRVIYALWFTDVSNSEVVNRQKVWFDSPYRQCRSFTKPLIFFLYEKDLISAFEGNWLLMRYSFRLPFFILSGIKTYKFISFRIDN